MIIARTYFQNSIPGEMLESARLDGCDDIRVLVNMVLPLSKSILAVLVLYYAIAHWNSYFDAFIYLSSENKFTLQVVLRNIMNSVAALEEMATTAEQSMRAANIEVLKYAIIVFGSIPLIILYPFVQKHFVKGVMIGSVKG
jgi:putative aldouronate transport system permease protein